MAAKLGETPITTHSRDPVNCSAEEPSDDPLLDFVTGPLDRLVGSMSNRPWRAAKETILLYGEWREFSRYQMVKGRVRKSQLESMMEEFSAALLRLSADAVPVIVEGVGVFYCGLPVCGDDEASCCVTPFENRGIGDVNSS